MKFNSTFIIILCLLITPLLSVQILGQEQTELLPIEEGRFWGFVDKEGNVVIEPKFISVGVFSEGLASVQLNEISKTTKTENGEFSEFKYGVINKKGEIVIDVPYDSVGRFVNGLASVRIGDRHEKYYYPGKYGFIDKTGEFVIKPQFQNARDFIDGLAEVRFKKYGDWYLIDKSGKTVRKADKFHRNQNNLHKEYPISKVIDSKIVFVDENGKVVFENKWDFVSIFRNGVAFVFNNDKQNYQCGLHVPGWISITDACFLWGYINNKGEYIWKKPELN